MDNFSNETEGKTPNLNKFKIYFIDAFTKFILIGFDDLDFIISV